MRFRIIMSAKFWIVALICFLGLLLGPARAWAQATDPDLNNDGVVNILDLSLVGSCFGQDPATFPQCQVADTDGDGDVDFDDLNFVLASFGQSGFPVGGEEEENVSVPDVVGLPQATAQTAITNGNLAVGNVTTANSPTVPAGDVISQDPVAGTQIAENSVVDLVVSLGPVLVSVPDVVGLPQADAEATIVGADLTVGNVTTANTPDRWHKNSAAS